MKQEQEEGVTAYVVQSEQHHPVMKVSCNEEQRERSIFMSVSEAIYLMLPEKQKPTRSTRRAQTSLAEADHYSYISQCNNVEPWW